MTSELYVGLMSGTSLDGVDAVLVDLQGNGARILGSAHHPYPKSLRDDLLALCAPGVDELGRAALTGNELARVYAATVASLLGPLQVEKADIRAIGCHGQTVRHRPDLGYSLQLGNASLLAELAGLRVVADLRSRDIAAGGQGAPLVPAFHAAMFADPNEDRVVLNLGGIANLTLLLRASGVRGFDSGPGNGLMDLWVSRHLGEDFDRDGAWANQGRVEPELLARLYADAYFSQLPPKSTGRERFNAAWLDARLQPQFAPADVQATLLELTVHSVATAVARHAPGAQRIIVCGGGAANRALMHALQARLGPAALEPSDRHGIGTQLVEATAFAWLAKQALEGRTSSLVAVTGARGARVLGAIYPA